MLLDKQVGRIENGRYIRPLLDINGKPVTGNHNTVAIGEGKFVEVPFNYRDFDRLKDIKAAHKPKAVSKKKVKADAESDDT